MRFKCRFGSTKSEKRPRFSKNECPVVFRLETIRVSDLPEDVWFVVFHKVIDRDADMCEHAIDIRANFCGNVQAFLIIV